MAERIVEIKMVPLEFWYLRGAIEEMAKKRCQHANCGTVCLCGPCAARRVLPTLEAVRVPART